jgi:hypothetical protein
VANAGDLENAGGTWEPRGVIALLHLILVAAWAGLVLAELVLELVGARRPEAQRFVADVHYMIDLFLELPILLGVLATGGWLLRGATFDTALAVKVACGLAAVLANLVCVALVIARHRGARATRAIFGTAMFGIPPALLAAYLGLSRLL